MTFFILALPILALLQTPPPPAGGGRQVVTTYSYETVTWVNQLTWIVGGLALAWIAWLLVSRYRRLRALRRPPRRGRVNLPKSLVRVKGELSSQYLRPGFSLNIHAVGIGKLNGSDDYCIQVFFSDPNKELWGGAGAAALPKSFRGMPLVAIEMPQAGFLSAEGLSSPAPGLSSVEMPGRLAHGVRDPQEVIIGGISGANTNLTGQSGTIGYFCTRKSKLPRRKEIHLLSNSHVFADLQKGTVDDRDLITQPSPGEPASNRPIAALVNFSPLKFDGAIDDPNHVDAAIAKLWTTQQHQPLIPSIGAIKGFVDKKDVEIGEPARKSGRTTGYTEGRIFSIHLDIWIRYDRTGQSAFFQDQFLIEPSLPQFAKFVAKGDSGSLLVDGEQRALGLIFAGMAELPESLAQATDPRFHRQGAESDKSDSNPADGPLWDGEPPRKIESYGVANPISEVLDRMKIDLLV